MTLVALTTISATRCRIDQYCDGSSGSSLATLLDAFVDLSVPRIRVVEVVELPSTLSDLVGKNNGERGAPVIPGLFARQAIIIFVSQAPMH